MTAREFINTLETYMPDLDVPLEIKFADTGEPCNIYPAGGTSRVVFYIARKEPEMNDLPDQQETAEQVFHRFMQPLIKRKACITCRHLFAFDKDQQFQHICTKGARGCSIGDPFSLTCYAYEEASYGAYSDNLPNSIAWAVPANMAYNFPYSKQFMRNEQNNT